MIKGFVVGIGWGTIVAVLVGVFLALWTGPDRFGRPQEVAQPVAMPAFEPQDLDPAMLHAVADGDMPAARPNVSDLGAQAQLLGDNAIDPDADLAQAMRGAGTTVPTQALPAAIPQVALIEITQMVAPAADGDTQVLHGSGIDRVAARPALGSLDAPRISGTPRVERALPPAPVSIAPEVAAVAPLLAGTGFVIEPVLAVSAMADDLPPPGRTVSLPSFGTDVPPVLRRLEVARPIALQETPTLPLAGFTLEPAPLGAPLQPDSAGPARPSSVLALAITPDQRSLRAPSVPDLPVSALALAGPPAPAETIVTGLVDEGSEIVRSAAEIASTDGGVAPVPDVAPAPETAGTSLQTAFLAPSEQYVAPDVGFILPEGFGATNAGGADGRVAPITPTEPSATEASAAPIAGQGLPEQAGRVIPQVRDPIAGQVSSQSLPAVSRFGQAAATASLPEPEPDAPPPPALIAFAAESPLAPDDPRPRLAFLIRDDPEDRLSSDGLTALPVPASIVLDPNAPDAPQKAQFYRNHGMEVVISVGELADMDFAERLETVNADFPETVALLDNAQSAIQGDRAALETVLDAMRESGQGFLAYPIGLNNAERHAAQLGLPAATLFREISDETGEELTRVLDRAALAAGQSGTAIVVLPGRSETLATLYAWALGGRSEQVALVPVSAILQDR
ncbi:MAG: divergent polysaccharide deacetylase family protein [Pseudomonadota bacterium]